MDRYLTTPIYYASGAPHLGHLYTTLLADAYRRYFASSGDDVFVTSGTDEHGQKIERTAAAAGVDTATFVDARSHEFRTLWASLDIPISAFERTTSDVHKAGVLAFWQKLENAGDLYRGRYEGHYCIDCEQYFTEAGECPVHRRPLTWFAEDSWFFRLSRYRERLIGHIESNPGFITPDSRRNEVLSFLRNNELRDLSVSRASTRWGIPVPGDEAQVIYVWVDALVSYLTAAPGRWQNVTHFIGKDILLFHAVYWPALLWSAGFEPPARIAVNGWLTVSGRKISKSDPATIVDPVEVAGRVTIDGLKYYFLRTAGLGADIDFDEGRLTELVNDELANGLGNLVSRFTRLATKHFPSGLPGSTYSDCQASLVSEVAALEAASFASLDAFDPGAAAAQFATLIRLLNRTFQQWAPWQQSGDELAASLAATREGLLALCRLGHVFVPDTARKIASRIDVDATGSPVITHGDPVFPRVGG